jgi:DNA-binding beta-propeller fold protein YncE
MRPPYSMAGFGHLLARPMAGLLSHSSFQSGRMSRAAINVTLALALPLALAGRSLNAQTAHFSGATIALGSGFNHPAGVAVDGSGNIFVADAGNNAMKEIVVSNPPSLTFTQTAVGSHFLGGGYVRSCFFLFTIRENAPDRLQALLLLSVVAI